jgi:CorA-like Mg2+ transporter protein
MEHTVFSHSVAPTERIYFLRREATDFYRAVHITVPTFIASFYGMNFDHMPELRWVGTYPLVIAVMIAAAVGLYVYFKRLRWLE